MKNKAVKNILKITSVTLIALMLIMGIAVSNNDIVKLFASKEKPQAYSTGVISEFKEIAAGASHSLAIDIEGNLWAWGNNSRGQFGNGTTDNSYTPIQIQLEQEVKFKSISTGMYHSMAIDEEGNLWAWGNNGSGQFGNGTTDNSYTPIQIQLEQEVKFKSISAGTVHSIAIDVDGNLWTWGNNTYGELGNGTTTDSLVPIQIKSGTKFKEISGGWGYSMAIDEDGNLWTWGMNLYGELGNDGHYNDRLQGSTVTETTIMTVPYKIKDSIKFIVISAGAHHSMAIDEAGNLWAWGLNSKGQLGNKTTTDSKVPIQIKSGTKFTQISAGEDHSMAIDEEGNLWIWGSNAYGQLGNNGIGNSKSSNEYIIQNIPIQIKRGTIFKKISAGYGYSIVIDEEGNTWTWGWNSVGQLGYRSDIFYEPIQIRKEETFKSIATGYNHSMAIDGEDKLWEWGLNYNGKLAELYSGDIYGSIQIKEDTMFMKISAGYNYSMALDQKGNLWTWQGNSSTNSTPKQQSTGKFFKEVSAGYDHYMAIDSEGNLWTWGKNDNGQLGNGQNRDETYLTQIQKDTKFKEISAGDDHSLAIDEAGNLWAWGLNSDGQLGNSSYEDSNIPVQVKEGTKFIKISAGNNHSMAIDEEGNLWTWGDNFKGQLGNSSNRDSNTPIKVKEGTKFKEISAGYKNSMAIDEAGNLWAWGLNEVGKLGNGNTEDSNIPIKIKEGTKFTNISVGYNHSIAIDEKGKLWGWGSNEYKKIYYKESLPTNLSENKTYKIELNVNGGIINSGNVTEYKYTEGAILPTDVTKEGYTFGGWYNNINCVGDAITEIGIEEKEDKQYYAKWIINTSNLNINPNGGNIGITTAEGNSETITESKTFTGNYNTTLTYNTPTKENDVSTQSYTVNYNYNGATSGNEKLQDTATKTTTISYTFSGWQKSEPFYGTLSSLTENGTYTYPAENGVTSTITANYTSATNEETTKVTLPTPQKTGYTFEGWYQDEALTTKVGNAGEEYTLIANTTIYAKWTANTNTPYKVEHYVRNLDIEVEGYELKETEEKQGTTDTQVTATYKEFEGFTKDEENSRNIATGTIAPNGSLVLKLYYSRNSYNISYELNEGVASSTLIGTYTYGKELILSNRVTKQGYTFGGWYDNESFTGNALTKITDTQVEDITLYANWIPNEDTLYTVEHYVRNLDLEVEGYILHETEEKHGTTASEVTATYKEFEGFTKDEENSRNIATGTIEPNGSLVLKLYYSRNSYNIRYELNEGVASSTLTGTYTYGKELILSNRVTKQGYTFGGWYDNENFTGNALTKITDTQVGDITLYANWIPNTQTPYRVEHYKQNIAKDGYELQDADIENKTGVTGQNVTAQYKSEEGFIANTQHPQKLESGEITADGSLVLKLYYDRKTYNVKINIPGVEGTQEYVYGEEITLPTNVEKEGYTFGGWYDNENFEGDPITKIVINEQTAEKEYHIKWIPNEGTAYTVEHYVRKLNTQVEEYEVYETEEKTGTTGAEVTAVALTNEGLTEQIDHSQRIPTGTIAPDGSLVLKLYYNRNSYSISYELNEGIATDLTNTYTYGEQITLSNNVTKQGYSFLGWYDNESFEGNAITTILASETGNKTFYAKWGIDQYLVTFKNGEETVKTETVNYGQNATEPELSRAGYTLTWDKSFENVTENITVNAVWTANTDTPYKIEHYLRNLDIEVEGYELFETEEKQGTTDTQVTATYKEYEGFTKDENNSRKVETGNVNGDGTLVLKLYYSRNSYNITYELNGGTAQAQLTNTYTYGRGLSLSNRLTKQGYIFLGWYNNEELEGERIVSIGTTEMGDKTFYAKWSKEEQYYVTSNDYSINTEEGYITKVNSETNVSSILNSIQTNGSKKIVNSKNEEVTGNELVGTGYKVQVTYKGETKEYEIAVRGDIDGNGRISVTDLSMINQVLANKIRLTGIKQKAADLDYAGGTTVTDLSMMNQVLAGKLKF